MALSEFTRKLVETKLTEYGERRIPAEARDQVKLIFKISRDKATLFETRRHHYLDPAVWTDTPIAQFRFDDRAKRWMLYCADRNMRWHPYDLIDPSADFDDMLKALDEDRTGIFWG